MQIEFKNLDHPQKGCVVVTAAPGAKKDSLQLSGAAELYNKQFDGLIDKARETSKFAGNAGQILTMTPSAPHMSKLVVVGTGKKEELSNQKWVDIGGDTFAAINQMTVEEVSIVLDTDDSNAAAYFAEGFELRSYKFDKYKTKKKDEKKELKKASIYCADPSAAKKAFAPLKARLGGVTLTRDLVSEVPNVLYPATMAAQLKELEKSGLKVTVLKRKELEKLGMNSLLAVGMGSEKEEHVVVMEWRGGKKDEKPLAFVGKGVTFDTGGISLKPSAGMHDMKWDMGGSAVVSGLLATLANRKAKVNAVGVVGLVENMPSGGAQRPGDVVKAMSGTTIECLNTDAEGRMVLADVLWYAQEKYDPKLVIDLATLTGAIIIALGDEIAGVFTNDTKLAQRLREVGDEVDEKTWELPMHKLFDCHIDSQVADIKNTGKARTAGSISAAKFLERFIKKGMPWAHIDIAGVTWAEKAGHMFDKGATGFGVRLLDTFVQKYYEGK